MTTLELSDEEAAALATALKRTIDADPYQLSRSPRHGAEGHPVEAATGAAAQALAAAEDLRAAVERSVSEAG